MRKLVAIIELISGALVLFGFVFVLGVMTGRENAFPNSWFILASSAIPLLFGLLNIYAGITLWRNQRAGYIASVITQLIQLLRIQTPVFYYLFYSIAGVFINYSSEGIASYYGIGASYFLSFSTQPVSVIYIGINLVALAMLVLIAIAGLRKR